jgi:hypothetical protein
LKLDKIKHGFKTLAACGGICGVDDTSSFFVQNFTKKKDIYRSICYVYGICNIPEVFWYSVHKVNFISRLLEENYFCRTFDVVNNLALPDLRGFYQTRISDAQNFFID